MIQTALLKPAHPDTPSELLAKLDLLRSNPTFDRTDINSVDIEKLIASLVDTNMVFYFDCHSECWAPESAPGREGRHLWWYRICQAP